MQFLPSSARSLARLPPIASRAFDEEEKLWALYVTGHVRAMQFQADPIRGLSTFEAPDKASVEGWLGELPLVADHLFTLE